MFLYTEFVMKIFKKINENRRAFFIALILIFNIPLAFGLTNQVKAYVVDGTSDRILNTPSSQNFFNILSPDAAKLATSTGCDANLGTGSFFDGVTALEYGTLGYEAQTALCLNKAGDLQALNNYFDTNSGGVMNAVSNIQATILDQRPASAGYYLEQKVYALQTAGQVYAQDNTSPAPYFPSGTGFQLLQPIQAFWGWAVNIVYGFLILIIIGIAFAIVFRNNLGGAQVVTIQSAIPSIALAMVLVPLSYAISGVFIDAITVGTNVVHAFLLGPGAPGQAVYDNRGTGTDGCTDTTDNPCDRGLYADDDRVNWFNIQKMVDISKPVENAAASIPDPFTGAKGGLVNNFFVFKIVSTILNLFSGSDKPSAYWFGKIINLVIGLTMIWIGLKILLKLFQKYLMLILMPIMSPFIFATAAIPGNGTKSIIEYVKVLGSASLFYIVTYAMFLLTIIFTSESFQNQVPDIQSGAFVPPLMGFKDIFQNTGALGSVPLTHFIFTLVGLGIYFSIPKVLEGIDSALGVPTAIPNFILTPINSFRESTNVTFRAVQQTGRAASGLNQLRQTAVPQASRTIQNRLDRLRGLKPGEIGTWEYRRKNELSQQRANAEREKRKAQNILENPNAPESEKNAARNTIAASNRAISNVDREVNRYGFEGVGYSKETPEPELKVEVKTKNGLGGPNILGIDSGFIESMTSGPGGFMLPLDMTIEAVGFSMPTNPIITIYRTDQLSASEYKKINIFAELTKTSGNSLELFGSADFPWKNDTSPLLPINKDAKVELTTDLNSTNADKSFNPGTSGNKLVIPLKVLFKNFDPNTRKAVLGEQSPSGNYIKGQIQRFKGGALTFGDTIKNGTYTTPALTPVNTNKLVFAITLGDGRIAESNAVSPVITIAS